MQANPLQTSTGSGLPGTHVSYAGVVMSVRTFCCVVLVLFSGADVMQCGSSGALCILMDSDSKINER